DSEGKFAVVGLPCHIQGIRKAELLFPKIKEKIVLCIGIICGPGPSFRMTDHLLRAEKVKREDVVELNYREGKIWPGGMTIKLKNGREKFIPLKEYLYAQTLFNRFRCGLCPDFANELADISLGDAHLPEFWSDETVTAPDGRKLKGEDGWNITISRTDFGDNILKRAKESGEIELIEISSERVVEAQKGMLQYKKSTIFALNNILKRTKQELPLFIGIKKLDKLAYHDYIKSLIFILSQHIVAFKLNRLIIARIPRKILMYKLQFRQKRIKRYIKDKSS
ncbi:Coenzyme F420 hydrogenase/dehydrogenase, beta subunit C-terminal domain, partial [bacterium]|nr:Coenzyme F420 hydrogenase/dehydrogenase, beta subunit C-terminal domain [bacterium]